MEDIFSNCKQYVGGGINTLMPISDSVGPSIFCRKMEKARPMREQIIGNVVFFSRQSRNFDFDVVVCKTLLLIFTLTWCINNYVFRQGKGLNRKNESTVGQNFAVFL